MSVREEGVPVDVASLLTIDVDAELRKLTSAQLQGPWQVPSELVRRAVRAGARAIDVTLSRHRMEITDDGELLARGELEQLGVLLDAAAPAQRRHQALLSLESCGALELLALSGLRARSIEIISSDGARRLHLEVTTGARPRVTASELFGARRGTLVRVRGLRARAKDARFDAIKAGAWLREMCRFAPGVVTLDGQPINTAARAYLCTTALTPLAEEGPGQAAHGVVALTHAGEHAKVWLLQHGVVTTHVGVNHAPCFEAYVDFGDMESEAGGRPSGADLRAQVGGQLRPLVEQATSLMLRLCERMPELPGSSRARVQHLLLRSARRGYLRAAIYDAPLLARVTAEGVSYLSLSALEAELEADASGYRHVQALYPEQTPERFSLRGAPVLVLDTTARSSLSELAKLRFHLPSARGDGQGLGERLERWLARAASATRTLLRFGARRPLLDTSVSPEERHFLESLRAVIDRVGPRAPHEVHFCRGRGAPMVTGGARPRLLLPRENRDIQAFVALVGRDDAWLYPTALALLRGHGGPKSSARATWIRAASRDSSS